MYVVRVGHNDRVVDDRVRTGDEALHVAKALELRADLTSGMPRPRDRPSSNPDLGLRQRALDPKSSSQGLR